ncbi:MAG: hypothetical protein GXO79_01105 [Chlorobi bacterium]|nr:hypothetical protein [Chlorobiota bacterium]
MLFNKNSLINEPERNMRIIKKIIPYFVFLFFTGLIISSCTDCKECRYVVKSNDTVIEEGEWVEYCGEELDNVENEEPVTVGGQTSEYECRSTGF